MDSTVIRQTSIWGNDVVLEAKIAPRQNLRIRPKFRPVPIFEDGDNSCLLIGVPSGLRREFQRAARQHAKDHPKAKALTYPAFLRAKHNPAMGRPTGRPSNRPQHVKDKTLWAAYLRAKASSARNTPEVEFPPYETWIARSEPRRNSALRSRSTFARSMRQEVIWVVEVPRCDMIKDPSIELEWHKRLHNDATLAKTHRIALRGVLRRVG